MDVRALHEKVKSWIAQDPDPTTRAELEDLLAQGADAELSERFEGELEFGTAGLRGVVGAGPLRMNRVVVRRSTAGLAAHLRAAVRDATSRGVVIGYDGRRMSRELAEDAASVLAGAGFVVHLWERMCPTPLVAFAVLHTGAAAGVMITASHNPPEYNGYKVYWDNGAQIIPPHDTAIRAAIDAVGPVTGLPMPTLAGARRSGLLRSLGAPIETEYLAAVAKLQLHPEVPKALGIVYSAMHGVGGRLACAALAQIGCSRVWPVPEQQEPDGSFPTVRFPNPEEKGALDRALARAIERDADLVIANDPDADRLAVAIRAGPGGYVQLSGDQVGSLLAYYLLTQGRTSAQPLVVTTLVSSGLLREMARQLGARYAETLTGFKWIANRALTLEAENGGLAFVMGYEEALGYAIGTLARDKDGISAGAVFAELTAFCQARGETVLDYLEEIYRRFGLFQSAQKSITLPGATGAAQIEAMMDRLRSNPPVNVGASRVVATIDVDRGIRRSAAGEEPLALPRSNVLMLELEEGGRITARPSGTEPKIKFYFEIREAIAASEPFSKAQARGNRKLDELMAAFLALVEQAP